MYERVGDAVLKANPDALIICEAVIDYTHGAYEGDFSVAAQPPRSPKQSVRSLFTRCMSILKKSAAIADPNPAPVTSNE